MNLNFYKFCGDYFCRLIASDFFIFRKQMLVCFSFVVRNKPFWDAIFAAIFCDGDAISGNGLDRLLNLVSQYVLYRFFFLRRFAPLHK